MEFGFRFRYGKVNKSCVKALGQNLRAVPGLTLFVVVNLLELRRPPVAHHTRTWKTGKLTPHQMDNLLTYFKNSSLYELDEYYQFPGEPGERGGIIIGDMDFTVSVNSGNLSKMVTASGYLTSDGGNTYPDMPPPLSEIYTELKNIAETKTEEVYSELIKD